jgi:predicted ribosomally synthesized peptide with SipW-like signal peptide
MQRILLSLGMIVFVGALAAGATGAFFSDTETSTGNTFAAGDIDLQIDNESYVTNPNGGRLIFSTSTSWAQSNLTNQLFFNFSDVKPGDIGEDTISVHVGSNDAWACMALDVTATPENTLVDPETDAGDVAGPNGELQNYLRFTFWEDDGDNVFETGETVISSLDNVLASSLQGQWHVLADSGVGNGPALVGGATNYIAKAWCFGTLAQAAVTQDTIGHTGTGIGDSTNGPLVRGTGFTCSGAGNQNDAQTDGISMDVSFNAVQSRNNAQFVCSSLPALNGQPN